MSEQITVTVSVEQAEALVSAASCASLCAEGNVDELNGTWVPHGTPEHSEADRWIVLQAELALQVSAMLESEIEGAYKRDPQMQDIIHAFKMLRKRAEGR